MKVLVAYASKHGSTEEIAEAIAGGLRGGGHEADCLDAGSVPSLDPYDAVVLGSAVYMRRWRREARRFLRRFSDELAKLPFWVFNSGPVGEPEEGEEESAWLEPPGVVKRIEALGVRDHVVFGGKVSEEAGGMMGRIAEGTPSEFQDRRDFAEISAWTARIANELETR